VGLQALATDAWIVWGLDDATGDETEVVIKIVGPQQNSHTDDEGGGRPYQVHQSWTTPNLACVRVCGNHLVTLRTGQTPPLWEADVYSYQTENDNFTTKPVVSFSSSAATASYGPLQASQCAWSTYGSTILEQGVNPYTERTGGLVLVNLTQDGTLTTHVSENYRLFFWKSVDSILHSSDLTIAFFTLLITNYKPCNKFQ
jgi:hypothetical protein